MKVQLAPIHWEAATRPVLANLVLVTRVDPEPSGNPMRMTEPDQEVQAVQEPVPQAQAVPEAQAVLEAQETIDNKPDRYEISEIQ